MAIVFGETSLDVGGFRERIAPSAIRRTLEEGIDLRALVDHDPAKVIGRVSAGTLRLRPDAHGLGVEIDVPDTTAGHDVLESVRRGDIDGMSFSFRALADEWTIDQGAPLRTVTDMRCHEISVCAFPAYPMTSVTTTRSLEDAMPDTHHLERRPARDARDTERPRAVCDDFLRAWTAAGRPRDFAMRFSYDPAKPTTLDERLKMMEGRRRLWEITDYQRAVGRLLEAEERARLRKLAQGPAPKSVAARLEWLKAKAAQW